MIYRPSTGSPRNLRELFYYLYNELKRISTSFSGLKVVYTTAIDAISVVDQSPTGLGDANKIQITFGDPQTTTAFDLDAMGNFTVLVSDIYYLQGKFSVGRSGNPGASQIYIRALINGVPVGYTTHAIIDTSRIEMPITFDGNAPLSAGDIITFEIMRDTDGHNSGGLEAGNPDEAGWADSPSARAFITTIGVG